VKGVELFEESPRRVKLGVQRFEQGLGQLLDNLVVTACRNALNAVVLVVKGLEDVNQRAIQNGPLMKKLPGQWQKSSEVVSIQPRLDERDDL